MCKDGVTKSNELPFKKKKEKKKRSKTLKVGGK